MAAKIQQKTHFIDPNALATLSRFWPRFAMNRGHMRGKVLLDLERSWLVVKDRVGER